MLADVSQQIILNWKISTSLNERVSVNDKEKEPRTFFSQAVKGTVIDFSFLEIQQGFS